MLSILFLAFAVHATETVPSVSSETESLVEKQSWWDLRLAGGYFYDGNVAQSVVFNSTNPTGPALPANGSGSSGGSGSTSGGRGFLSPGPGGGGGGGNPSRPDLAPPSGMTLTDMGYRLDTKVEYALTKNESSALSLIAGENATFYQKYASYNYQSYSLGIEYYVEDPDLYRALTLSFVDTRYQSVYSQDYLRLEPEIRWTGLSPEVELTFDFTKYMVTNLQSYYLSTTALVRWKWKPIEFAVGGSGSYGSGQKANYLGTGATTIHDTGLQFSNYWSVGPEIDFSWRIARNWSLQITEDYYQIQYGKENLPANIGAGLSTAARTDYLWTSSAAVKYSFDHGNWLAAFEFDYTNNSSTGYQGLLSSNGGGIPNTSYTRPYVLAKIRYTN